MKWKLSPTIKFHAKFFSQSTSFWCNKVATITMEVQYQCLSRFDCSDWNILVKTNRVQFIIESFLIHFFFGKDCISCSSNNHNKQQKKINKISSKLFWYKVTFCSIYHKSSWKWENVELVWRVKFHLVESVFFAPHLSYEMWYIMPRPVMFLMIVICFC